MKSKTKTIKKVLGLALSLSICASFIPGALTTNAEGETVTSDYTITIPAALDVANSGWNAIGDISATGTLASGKKLTVTAESANNWALVSGQNSVSYTLCNSTMSLEKGDAATSWDFTELNNEPNRKFIGIDVADYSEKPAGTYQDTVTFTASVESAVPTLAGVTLTDGMIIEPHCTANGSDNWVQFKYVAADNNFVPNFNSYNDARSKSGGSIMQHLADQWAYSVLRMNENPYGNFYLTQTGNTVHLRADDGIKMEVIDLQLDFDNMTYTQSYKYNYQDISGSFTSIKIGDTTIAASQMTAQ